MKFGYRGRSAPSAALPTRGVRGRLQHPAGWQRVFACLALSIAGGTCAQEATYQPAPAFRSSTGYVDAHAGFIHTDNVTLAQSDRKGESLASAGFDIDYTHKSSNVDLDSRGVIDWVKYLSHTYDDIASGSLNARAVLGNSSDLLQWMAWETFGQLTSDPLAAATPVNIENVNYFTTGPYLNLTFGPRDRLSFHALYSNSYYQKSPFDSNAYDGGVSLAHAVSASSGVSLDFDSRRTEFRNHSIATDYDVRSADVSFNGGTARTRFTAEAGYSWLHYRMATSGSPLLSLELDRRISPASTVYVRAQTSYAGAADSIRSGAGPVAPTPTFAGVASPNPIKQRTASLGWTYDYLRTTLSVYGSLIRQRYEQQATLDQNSTSLQATILRRLAPSLSATLSVQRADQKYPTLGANVTQIWASAGLSKTFRQTGLSIRYDRIHRGGSSQGSGLVGLYDENRVGLYVSYDVLGHRLNP